MNKLSVIYFESDNYGCGQIFLKGDEVLSVVNDNDADWRHEYFDHILANFGLLVDSPSLEEDEVEQLLKSHFGF